MKKWLVLLALGTISAVAQQAGQYGTNIPPFNGVGVFSTTAPPTAATPSVLQGLSNDPTVNGVSSYVQSNTGSDVFKSLPANSRNLGYANGRLMWNDCTAGSCSGWNVVPETLPDIWTLLGQGSGCQTPGYLPDPANKTCDAPGTSSLPSGTPNMILATQDANAGTGSSQVKLRAITANDLPAAITPTSVAATYVTPSIIVWNLRSKVGNQGTGYLISQDGPTFNSPQCTANCSFTLPKLGSGIGVGSSWWFSNINLNYTMTVSTTSGDGTTMYGINPAGGVFSSDETSVVLQPGQSAKFTYTGECLAAGCSNPHDWVVTQ